MDAAAAAAVLTARDPKVSATEQYPAAGAVWSAVAQAVGAGITAASPDPTTTPAPTASAAPTDGTASPTSSAAASAGDAAVAALFDQLIHGRVGSRALRADPIPADQNIGNVDASLIDPAEAVLVFGQIAPGAVSAPGSGLSFRVVSAFSDDQLADTGLTNTEVAYRAIATILSIGGNVVSVATDGATPGAATTLAVSDATMTDGAKAVQSALGTVEVTVDEHPIAGVDVVAVIGTDALPTLGTATRSRDDDHCLDDRPDDGDHGWLTTGPDDDARTVALLAARAADEKQGRNIVVLDVGEILAIAELFVVLEAPNRRLVRTLVDEIEQAVRAGHRALAASRRRGTRAAVGADGLRRRRRPRVPRRDPPLLRDRAPVPGRPRHRVGLSATSVGGITGGR